MTRTALEAYCLTFPDAQRTTWPRTSDIAFFRHSASGRWFGFTVALEGKDCVILKNKPDYNDFLCRTFTAVRPGWHMNKQHWITVELAGDVPDETLQSLVAESHSLTR